MPLVMMALSLTTALWSQKFGLRPSFPKGESNPWGLLDALFGIFINLDITPF